MAHKLTKKLFMFKGAFINIMNTLKSNEKNGNQRKESRFSANELLRVCFWHSGISDWQVGIQIYESNNY